MDVKKSLRMFLILVLFAPIAAYGVKNVSQTGQDSGFPAIAVNQQGIIMVVWPEGGEEAGILWYNVYKDGEWQGSKNANITSQEAWSPQLDVDPDGNFHLAFADGRGSATREIYHTRYNIEEDKWPHPDMIWRSPMNSAWQKIDIEGDSIYIVWHHQNTGIYIGHDIIMQTKLIGEEWPSVYERISWTANDNSTHPAFKVLNGKIHCVYMEGVGDSPPWRLFYKEGKAGSGGAAFENQTPFKVAGLGYRPELAIDDNGDTHIVYAVRDGNFMYRSKINGTWRAMEVISNKYSEQQFGDINYNNNVLVATWMQYDDDGKSIYYAKKVVGGKWETPVQIEPGTNALYPRVWIDDNGYAHFVWRDRGNIWYEKIAVPPADPFIQLNPQSMSFTVEGKNPDPAIFTVKNIGESSLKFSVTPKDSWISVTPQEGELNQDKEQEIEITIDAFDLEEGSYTGTVEVTSKQAINSPQALTINLEVLAPPIYPPLNFTAEVQENKALFYREYIHSFTWEQNPQNRNIENYRLYEIDGVNTIFLEEFSSSTFEYKRRHIQKNKAYTYELWAVDDKGRTGDQPATVTLSAVSSPSSNSNLGKSNIKK